MLFERAGSIYKTQGFISLLRRALAWCFFNYQAFYLLGNIPDKYRRLQDDNPAPKIDDLSVKLICTNDEADILEADGYEFRSHTTNARSRLDNGAIAACTFIGTNFASIRWYGLTQQSVKAFNIPPLKVNFDKNEVLVADIFTIPEYRGKGLTAYTALKALEFLAKRGTERTKGVVRRDNVASLRGNIDNGGEVYAEGRYLRILFLKFWREKPLPQNISCGELPLKKPSY